MDRLLDRALRAAQTSPCPALRWEELRQHVRESGVAVADALLERALRDGDDRLRVLDPRRGALHTPVGRGADEALPPAVREVAGSRWVVARPRWPGEVEDRSPLGLLRDTVAHLGWRLDGDSGRDLARWSRFVRESERVRRACLAPRG